MRKKSCLQNHGFLIVGKKMYGFLLIVTEYFPKYSVIIRTSADAPPYLLLLHKWDFLFSFKMHELKQKKIHYCISVEDR